MRKSEEGRLWGRWWDSMRGCCEPCWHSSVGTAESPHASTLVCQMSVLLLTSPQCYVCRHQNCWTPQPMLLLMLQEKSKYFSSPTRAAQCERLSWKQDCFLLAPLCLPYVYHSVCKNILYPRRAQPPTEFCTCRTTSPHTQLTHSQIPAQLQQQTQLDLTGELGVCSNTDSSRPYIIYFEVKSRACPEEPDSQAGTYVLPPGTKYSTVTSPACTCRKNTCEEVY